MTTRKKRKSKKNSNPDIPPVKLGRPSPYDPNRHPEWVRGLSRRGATVPEICKAMGISHTTMNAWRALYPDFLAALQMGRNETAARLHNSLYKRAEGFTEPATESQIIEHPDGTQTKRITRRQMYFPPDVAALKVALVNLDPAFKTERTENEIIGRDGGPVRILHEYALVKGVDPPARKQINP